jgi:hypothetical protein
MGSWTSSNPCKNCGRTSGTQLKCTNCNTLGCSNGNCGIGQLGNTSTCKICKKATKTVKL